MSRTFEEIVNGVEAAVRRAELHRRMNRNVGKRTARRRPGAEGRQVRRLEMPGAPSSRTGSGLSLRLGGIGTPPGGAGPPGGSGYTKNAAGLVEVQGQVIVYDTPYEVFDMAGSFTETIHSGACAAALADPSLDVRLLYGHESSALMPLARTNARTSLTLSESPTGLNIDALVDPTMSVAHDLCTALANGSVNQMSVGMVVDPAADQWSGEDEFGLPNVRHIYRLAEIMDVSAVAYPASPTTSISLAAQYPWQKPSTSDPDGTNVSGPGNAPGIGNPDGTGSRSIDLDLDMVRAGSRNADIELVRAALA